MGNSYCFSVGYVRSLFSLDDRMKKKPVKSIKQLEKKLQGVLYPLIKKRDTKDGKRICISCGKRVEEGADWQAGHFGKAELCNLEYRYKEENINGQCSSCNHWKAGNTLAYERGMRLKYGDEITDDIKDNHDKPLPMNFNSRCFLEDKIAYYKSLSSLVER